MNSETHHTENCTSSFDMVLIPAGLLIQGSKDGYNEEIPLREIELESFYIDRYPVTNAQYKVFCDEQGLSYPEQPCWPEMPDYFIKYPNFPVVNVSWTEADSYAKWAGKRLPTEAEWEYAAAGGLKQPAYPWGDEDPANRANYADRNTDYPWRDFRFSSGYRYTAPVGEFSANGYGLYDMAGNVWEWCADWFYAYDDELKDDSGLYDGWGGSKVCRGGCYHSSSFDLRIARRRQVLGGQKMMSVGFRCVRSGFAAKAPEIIQVNKEQKIDLSTISIRSIGNRTTPAQNFSLCMGTGLLEISEAQKIKSLGFTCVQQYVTWNSIESTKKDCFDFSVWDRQIEILQSQGLKWVPFLICGPAYSLPAWFRESRGFIGLRCLEHNIESTVQSIWDKDFHQIIERFIRVFATKYSDMNIVDSLVLGISGDFGESIFPDWHGNWTTQTAGLYHSHAGYWCNDPLARKDFRLYALNKYTDLASVNKAWGTSWQDIVQIAMPEVTADPIQDFRVDEHTSAGRNKIKDAHDAVRWIDFIDWYRDSMDQLARFWLKTCQKYYPDLPVYLCTGGYGQQYHGVNFASQCKIAAEFNAGVRITNEASKYDNNFYCTNWITSAARFYNALFGFEPAGQVNEHGVVNRIFNAAASGVAQLHFYPGNIIGDDIKEKLLAENLHYLGSAGPIREIGVFYPDTAINLGDVSHIAVMKHIELFRDFADFSYIEEQTLADGILEQIKCLILFCNITIRPATYEKIRNWLKRGGRIIAYNMHQLKVLGNEQNVLAEFFSIENGSKSVGEGGTLFIDEAVKLENPLDDRFLSTLHLAKINKLKWEKPAGFYQDNVFSPMRRFIEANGCRVPDGQIDGVYVTLMPDGLLLYNSHMHSVNKQLKVPDCLDESINIPGNCIKKITGNY